MTPSGGGAGRQILASRPGTVVVLVSTCARRSLLPEIGTCGAARLLPNEQLGPDTLAAIAGGLPN
ncbi:MAG TPA: hypothetical protein VKV06_17650 [Acidimicrobiales bacterium]|nr:hypothetical protein [Acidimicrobiales bacterium]